MGFLLQSCSTSLPVFTAQVNKKIMTIPVSKFQELKTNLLLLRNNSLEYDILLVKNNDGYKALSMECTHQSASLTPTTTKIICSAHGSQFDLNGNVIKEPALTPLHQYKTVIQNQSITIFLS